MTSQHYHNGGIRVLDEVICQAIPADDSGIQTVTGYAEPKLDDGFIAVTSLSIGELGCANSAAGLQFEELQRLVLQVCPTCLAKQRNDSAWIFVPPERRNSGRNKNLMTVWLESSGVRLRIMPDPEERFEQARLAQYKSRLSQLYTVLVNRID